MAGKPAQKHIDFSPFNPDNKNMKKLVLLFLLASVPAHAGIDNAWGVNQEKLDIYRKSHPRYNFPKNVSELIEAQSKQILEYFYDEYRFDEYKYEEITTQVWDIFIHKSISDTEKSINNCIVRYYEFNKSEFYAPFGSLASIGLLNGMKPENAPQMLRCLYEIKY